MGLAVPLVSHSAFRVERHRRIITPDGHCHTNGHPDSNPDRLGDRNTNGNGDSHSDGDGYSDRDRHHPRPLPARALRHPRNGNCHRNGHPDGNGDADRNADRDGNGNLKLPTWPLRHPGQRQSDFRANTHAHRDRFAHHHPIRNLPPRPVWVLTVD